MSKKTPIFVVLSAALLSLALMLPSSVVAEDASAQLYKTKCAACHGPDGKGETAIGKANKLRDLGSPEVQKATDADIATIITSGKNKMPAYGKSLTPDQIKGLVGFLRGLAKK